MSETTRVTSNEMDGGLLERGMEKRSVQSGYRVTWEAAWDQVLSMWASVGVGGLESLFLDFFTHIQDVIFMVSLVWIISADCLDVVSMDWKDEKLGV